LRNFEQDLDEYITKYCKKHKITREEAEKHYMVRAYKEWLESQREEVFQNGDQKGV
jgi:hypothetical protein